LPEHSPFIRLPLAWPQERPVAAPGEPGIATYLSAIRARAANRPFPAEQLDPVAIPYFRGLPSGARLRLLDQLYRIQHPSRPELLDRFIDAYLLLAEGGFLNLPGRGRQLAGVATCRALEAMDHLFRLHWRRLHTVPTPLWQRFMATFRAAGKARLFPVRTPSLEGGSSLSPIRVATEILLRSVANPFAWEPDITPSLDRLLALLTENVLLFPAASPSAYAKNRSGRFVVDASGSYPPVPPEGLVSPPLPGEDDLHPRWWIIDTSPALNRLATFRRSLSLGVPADRVHPSLAEIPPATRRVLLDRLERILSRRSRTPSTPEPGQRAARLVVGLEQTVRHNFARRWSGSGDPTALATHVRMQGEMGTQTAQRPMVQEWQVLDSGRGGLRLQSSLVPDRTLIGQVALLLDREGQSEPTLALVRWQRILAHEGTTEVGLEQLKGIPKDCWCRVGWGSGPSLQEHPAIFLAPAKALPELICPAGLFQPGGTCTIRTDNRNHSVKLLRLREADVHFERIEVQLQGE
jgi:hypothetical protein